MQLAQRHHPFSIRRLLLPILVVFFIACFYRLPWIGHAQSWVSITDCGQIKQSGNYRINNNISTSSSVCLDIRGNDITIDGNGKTITMNSGGDALAIKMQDPSVVAQQWHNISVSNFISTTGDFSTYADVHHITVDNVTVTGVSSNGSHYLTITNSTINGGVGISNLGTTNATFITFTGNTVTGNSDRLAVFSGDAHTVGNCDTTGYIINNNTFTDTFATNANNPVNVYLSCTENGSFNNNTVISTNEATGTLIRDGWSNNSFSNNTIHVNTAVFDTRAAIAIVSGSSGGPPNNNTFSGNTVIADNGKALLHYMETTGNVFQNNLFVSNSTIGNSITYTSETPGIPVQFIHNTFVERGSGAGVAFANDSMKQLLFRDNIVVTNGGAMYSNNGTRTGTTLNHNLYKNRNGTASFGSSGSFAAWVSAAGDTNSLEADPKFVDYANGNYHLQAGSPALGAGTGGSDIGAYSSGASCTESWTCGAWSACTNNSQTRTCTDAFSCGTIVNRPALVQSCDSTSPTVTVTAPTNSATVSGTISVTATASDNIGVSGVQFTLDGQNLGTEDTSSPYAVSWATTGATNATHTITAVARDAAGNTTTSSTITVTVNNAAGCIEDWLSVPCSAWSSCVNGTQTRTCTDSHNCGTTVNRPPLTQSCSSPDTIAPSSVQDLRAG